MTKEAIGQVIKDAMKDKGVTLDSLGEATGIARVTLNSLRQGKGNPTLGNLMAVLEELGLEIELKKV